MKNSIIYPTDFSECAEQALAYAITMAQAMDCKLNIVHAIDVAGVSAVDENPRLVLDKIEYLQQEADQKLDAIKDRIRKANVDCASEVIKGNMIYWLPEYLEKVQPKLVVMGTTGSGGFENKIIGSLTYKVIKNTDIPVLAVPEKATYKDFKNLIFSTDYHQDDADHLNFLLNIASHFKANVEVVHIAEGNFDKQTEKILLTDFKNDIEAMISYPKLSFKLLYWEDVEERLSILLKESDADLLAMVTRKRSLIDRLLDNSLTKKMVYHTQTPVLVFS